MRGVLLLFAFLLVFSLPVVVGEGNARENYEEPVSQINIRGKQVTLLRFNTLRDTILCNDEHGSFNVWESEQGYRIRVNGELLYDGFPAWQGENYQHCNPKVRGHWNYESWSELTRDFFLVGDFVRVHVRRFGGKCYHSDRNRFPDGCFDTHDGIDLPEVRVSAECTSGPCCVNGEFRSDREVCEPGMRQTESCGQGGCGDNTRTRIGDRFCSGDSGDGGACSGRVEWGPWSECTGGNEPGLEICYNGKDDDCDGEVDEGWNTCMDYSTCTEYSTCEYPCPPLPGELCDTKDNNCNGEIDEGFDWAFPLHCQAVSENGKCWSDGNWGCVPDGEDLVCLPPLPDPVNEICDNGIDDDCDGLVDNDPCGCDPGEVQECGSDVGECRKGRSTCGADGLWGECVGVIWPATETCDGKDNDCNEMKDDIWPIGERKQCEESRQGTCEEHGFFWNGEACCGNHGSEGPPWGREVCGDRLDNDCDRWVDEWDDLDTCPVRCVDGTKSYHPEGDDDPRQCSPVTPYYCEYDEHPKLGEFITNCDVCGCPAGKSCNTATGICSSGDTTPPELLDFELLPDAAVPYQGVSFSVQFYDESNILDVNLYYAYFADKPSASEIEAANFREANIHFYDDGDHGDRAANDKVFGALLPLGFDTMGYYAFKVEATDVFMNNHREILTDLWDTLFVIDGSIPLPDPISLEVNWEDEDTILNLDVPLAENQRAIMRTGSPLGGPPVATFFNINNNLIRRKPLSGGASLHHVARTVIPDLKYGFREFIPSEPPPPGSFVLEFQFEPGRYYITPQKLLLDFDGGTNVIIHTDHGPYNFGPFNAGHINPDFEGQEQYMKDLITQIIREEYDDYDVEVYTTDGALPTGKFSTVYFADVVDPVYLGLADNVDEYNADRSQNAIVYLISFALYFYYDIDEMSQAIANVGGHEAGHLLGLWHVADPDAIMDTTGSAGDLAENQWFKRAELERRVFGTGYQDSPEKLVYTVGAS